MSGILETLGLAQLSAIMEHAGREAPREACGLLLRDADQGTLHYLSARNLHAGPAGQDRFLLDPEAWTAADAFGEAVAVVHSHPHASANPSMADRVMCARSGLPWIIVSWPSGAMVALEPDDYEAPLEGRSFCFGVLDCYALAQDWYRREWGLQLPDVEREEDFAARGQHLYRDHLAAAGFVELQTTEPQRGDGLLMRVLTRNDVENHAAVYLGDGYMLHHLAGELSRKERWDWPWQRRTTAIVRHRSRMPEGGAA